MFKGLVILLLASTIVSSVIVACQPWMRFALLVLQLCSCGFFLL
ncbi:27003_t:CDS:1, partial [Dentiscutata erythropus]